MKPDLTYNGGTAYLETSRFITGVSFGVKLDDDYNRASFRLACPASQQVLSFLHDPSWLCSILFHGVHVIERSASLSQVESVPNGIGNVFFGIKNGIFDIFSECKIACDGGG